jgi:hypothetical protein
MVHHPTLDPLRKSRDRNILGYLPVPLTGLINYINHEEEKKPHLFASIWIAKG